MRLLELERASRLAPGDRVVLSPTSVKTEIVLSTRHTRRYFGLGKRIVRITFFCTTATFNPADHITVVRRDLTSRQKDNTCSPSSPSSCWGSSPPA